MKIFVDPAYDHLREFIGDILQGRYECVRTLHRGRNVIEHVVAPDGTDLVVKRYKRPTRANQVVYTFLRWSKPRRSCEFARRFEQMGLHTAEPVAWIEIPRNGIFHTGYLITRLITDPILADVDCLPAAEREEILEAFTRYTVMLHRMGVKHGDYHAKNVFYRYEEGGYRFSLIDINRVQFRRRLSRRACTDEFRRLFPRREMIGIAERYAVLRGWNPDLFCAKILIDRGFKITSRLKKVLHAAIRPFTRAEPLPVGKVSVTPSR